MKKVIALALAVLMLATVAFAAKANTYPGNTLSISRDEVSAGSVKVVLTTEGGVTYDATSDNIGTFIPRSVNTTNYSVTNVKFKLGKGLISEIKINDTDDCIDIVMVDDMTNTKAQSFEASFKLKGKAKYTLTDSEIGGYLKNQETVEGGAAAGKLTTKGANAKNSFDDSKPTKVTLPNLDFEISGTVGYGLVDISLGTDNDEEIESLVAIARQLADPDIAAAQEFNASDYAKYNTSLTKYLSDDDILRQNIFKFTRSTSIPSGTVRGNNSIPAAGAFTADALLTQEYGDALTMEARVYDGDKLYFGLKYGPNKTIVSRLADADGDLDFYTFGSDKAYTTFNSNVKLYFNDADEDSFVYKVNDNGYLVQTGNYSEEDGCWVVSTRTLGTYVVTDVELDDTYVVEDGSDPSTTNPDTGANDVVGIATALAAVALVSAAAISLKK